MNVKTEMPPMVESLEPHLRVRDLNFFYGAQQALHQVSVDFMAGKVTAIIGPSGCGKSTLLRVFNRVYSLHAGQRAEGHVELAGEDILAPDYDLTELRLKVGMVFQAPIPFTMSIYDNLALALTHHEALSRSELDDRIELALRHAALWDEVKDHLRKSALSLSGGQQQRLCIARAVAIEPEILLMDEPTSALDPIATGRIEELIDELRNAYTIIIVTHNLHQAARVSQRTVFMYRGQLVEQGATDKLFTAPDQKATQDYMTGRFG